MAGVSSDFTAIFVHRDRMSIVPSIVFDAATDIFRLAAFRIPPFLVGGGGGRRIKGGKERISRCGCWGPLAKEA